MRENDIMEAREVADYLRLHLFTIHRLAREAQLPGFKIGNDWRFKRSSVEAWIRKQEKLSKMKRTHSPNK